jgi:hypothetical protein
MAVKTPIQPGTKLNAQEAIALLPANKPRIHTFQRVLGWAGCDCDREDIVALINAQGGAVISDEAAHFDHHLVIIMDNRRTFIETLPM